MSVYLLGAEQAIIVEFPFNTLKEVEDAVAGWMSERRIIHWQSTDNPDSDITLLVNFGNLINVMLIDGDPPTEEPGEGRSTVRAVLEGSPDRWDVQQLTD